MHKLIAFEDMTLISESKSSQRRATCVALGRIAHVGFRQPELVKTIIPDLIGYLSDSNSEVCSRACWAFGQIGLQRPKWVQIAVPRLTQLIEHPEARVREEAIWALGCIGRAQPEIVKSYLDRIWQKANDEEPQVRLAVIRACENIAAQRPEWFANAIPLFAELLDDPDTRYVRREAPEILRIIGKRRPDLVRCAAPKLIEKLTDPDSVVRMHAQGALNVIQRPKAD